MKLADKVLVHKLGKTYLVYDYDKGKMHELNETGYEVLMMIGKYDGREIVRKLRDKYKIREERAKNDYRSYVELLKKRELIVE